MLNRANQAKPIAHANIATSFDDSRRHDYVIALDQTMGNYTFTMKESVRKYLVIIFPFGKFCYIKMPLGHKISADIFQREMNKLFQNLDYVPVYIDNLLMVTKSTVKDHLIKLRSILLKLREKGMR